MSLHGRGSPVEDPSYPKKQAAPDASVVPPSDRETYFVSDIEAVHCADEQAATQIISSPASPDGKHGFAKLFAAIDVPGPDYLAALRPYDKS
jgi:hypothetical protein